MKTRIKIISLFLMFFLGTLINPQKASAQGVTVSFQVFYDELSPYGTWVDSPDYGYVWVPDVAPGFTPYATNGYWVLTDDGWTWVSNYSWGWAPFHYGRWYNDETYGPMWVPGNEWGPGWVTWRRSNGYYGWAPIGPGISIDIAYSNGYNVPYNQWRFVRDRDFGRRDINNYYVNSSTNVTIINNSTVINNTHVDRMHNVTYNAGPARKDVETHVGKTITPVTIKESSKPGQKLNQNQLQIYRPQVQKTVSTGQKPAPTKVESLKNLKPPSQRVPTPPIKNSQPVKQQPSQQKNTQPAKQQQKDVQPVKQQPSHQKTGQPVKQQQPAQQQHNTQPVKQQQPAQQQHNAQPVKQQQPAQQQHNAQPVKQQQPAQQQHNAQPVKQQHNTQPPKHQSAPQQHNTQPEKQQQSQPQQNNPPKKEEKEQGSKQDNPHKTSWE